MLRLRRPKSSAAGPLTDAGRVFYCRNSGVAVCFGGLVGVGDLVWVGVMVGPPGVTVAVGVLVPLPPPGVGVRVGVGDGPPGVAVRVEVGEGPTGVGVRVGVGVLVTLPPSVAVGVGVAVGPVAVGVGVGRPLHPGRPNAPMRVCQEAEPMTA